jgi:cytochrome c oxidase subunit 1
MADATLTAEPESKPEELLHGWRRYVYATNHKDVGTMFLWFAVIAGIAGAGLSMLIRAELMEPGLQYFRNSRAFAGLVTGHGLVMVFFAVLPALFGGFGNWLVPMMIGAPNTAFPRLNALSFWLMPFAFTLLILALFVPGGGADWSVPQAAGPAMDFVVTALALAAASTILAAINFITTILNMRSPGMTLHRMPLFVWSILVTAFVLLLAMPVLAATVTLIVADRHFNAGVFDAAHGGDPLLYRHLVWFFAHPEAIALILPGIGIAAQVIQALAVRPAFAYRSTAYAMVTLGFLGFLGWAEHLYSTGLSAAAGGWFLLANLAAVVPAAVLIGNLIATLWGGSISFKAPMLFAIGFILMFTLGGLSGVVLANPGLAPLLSGSAYAVAHLHYAVALSAVFAIFAGFYFWFPKFTGYRCNDSLAKIHFWITFIGANMAFFPLHLAGLAGMPGRAADYASVYAPWNYVSSIGAFIAGSGILIFIATVAEAFAKKRKAGDNPWGVGAATLEWTLSSPPPFRTFNELPKIM